MLSSRIFISEKGRLGVAIRKGSTENFEMMFFGHCTKNVALNCLFILLVLFVYNILFSLFRLVPQKLHVDPKT